MAKATGNPGGVGDPSGGGGIWAGSGPRRPRRFRPPSARAVLGAALVALAAGGVLMARGALDAAPGSSFLVVTTPVAAGERLGAGDLGAVALDLPTDLSAIPSEEASHWIGRTVRHPLQPMDILRPGDLAEPGAYSGPEAVRVAVEVASGRVPVDDLRASGRADLLATAAEDGGTAVLAEAVPVRLTSDDSGGIGGSDRVRLAIEVPDRATAVAVADAAVRAELSVAVPSPAATDRADRG